MLKVMAFLSKRPGMDGAAFVDYYENRHVPLILSLAPPPPHYKRNYVVRDDAFNLPSEAIGFDVVTETGFPDRESLMAWISTLAKAGPLVREDEAKFLDHSKYWAYVVDERTTVAGEGP